MVDETIQNDSTQNDTTRGDAAQAQPAAKKTAKKAAKKTANVAKSAKTAKTAKTATAKTASKKAATARTETSDTGTTTAAADAEQVEAPAHGDRPARKRTAKKAAAPRNRAGSGRAAPVDETAEGDQTPAAAGAAPAAFSMPLFQAPDLTAPPRRSRRATSPATVDGEAPSIEVAPDPAAVATDEDEDDTTESAEGAEGTGGADDEGSEGEQQGGSDAPRKRRRRGGRGRRGRPEGEAGDAETQGGEARSTEPRSGQRGEARGAEAADDSGEAQDDGEGDGEDRPGESTSTRRRRRRRRRSGGDGDAEAGTDEPNTVVRVREARSRSTSDEITGVRGSTRLEAKKQRRREGREAGRRKQVITESEFLARRESVERIMVVRQTGGRTQIGVMEDDVLVEHYVSREANASMAGNVYLGRVQNVLPSMEAAFVDIGKGRNAVLYAGEVNWDSAGLEGQAKRIENVLKSGEAVLVQVTKDPIGHKGARLTSQISLPGRYLVYVPEGSMTGISRKLPDTERTRLKAILKAVLPEGAGVIVRTAAEGASEEELRRDVERLAAQWEAIKAGAQTASAPALLHGEPDLTVRVIRDIFNEDFSGLVVAGEEAWGTVSSYVGQVAPDLTDRVSRWTGEGDAFAHYRIDEQLAKALDRKVWLPSGGSLVIDRTEAMTVVDVNTGKFTGSGGNLEETVTKNNIEAAEEIVRQLRLRDIGGIIVIDFIDMVLESNRDLVLRRLLECLGRDRTKHQVAEVTSLGLVQMTRKRVGQGLLEVFSETCEVCHGRGIIVHTEPVEKKSPSEPAAGPAKSTGRAARGGRGRSAEPQPVRGGPSPAEIAARAHAAAQHTGERTNGDLAEGEHGHEHEVYDVVAVGESDVDLSPEPIVEAEVVFEPEAAEPEVFDPEIVIEREIVIEPEVVVDAEPAAVVDEVVEVDEVAVVDEVVEVEETRTPEPAVAAVAAPRRRRGRATAPAGPPTRTDGGNEG